MRQERRTAPRVRADLNTHWAAGENMYEGIIRDISRTGCFILATERVSRRLHVFIEIGLPGLLHMRLQGAVTREVRGVGFGVKFHSISATERLMLERLLQQLTKKRSVKRG